MWQKVAAQVSVFQNITVENGLPSNYVFDISEDEHGFLWAGTDKGLAMYNGFSWKVYTTANGLPGNYVNQVSCAGNGCLWLGIGGQGLYFFDSRTLKITRSNGGHSSLGFFKSSTGSVFYIKPHPKRYDIYRIGRENPEAEELQFSLQTSSRRYSWDVEQKEIVHFGNNPQEAAADIQYLKPGWTVKHIPLNNIQPAATIYFKASDSVYYSAPYVLTTRNGQVAEEKIMAGNPGPKMRLVNVPNGYWVFDKTALVQFSANRFSANTLYNNNNGLGSTLVENIYVSQKGQTLFCTMGAGIQILQPPGNIYMGTGDEPVNGIALNGTLAYTAAGKNLFVTDLSTGTLKAKYTLAEKQVMGIYIINGDIYLPTLFGVNQYAITGTALVKKASWPLGAGISSLLNVNGTIVAATYGVGIVPLDTIKKGLAIGRAVQYPVIEKLQPLRNGYAAYDYENGVYFFNAEHKEQAFLNSRNGLPSNAVYQLFEEGDSIWVCTSKGVSLVRAHKVVNTYSVQHENSTGKCIASFRDRSGRFWMVSNKYLWRFTGKGFVATAGTPIIKNLNDQAVAATYNPETNSLVVGTGKQVMVLDMGRVQLNEIVAAPSLLQAMADERVFDFSKTENLPYSTGDIRFLFRPAFINHLAQSRIFYKLEGLGNEYLALSDSLGLRFNKLRAGHYRLVAKTINADGFESPETVLCSFTIKKPYWQQTWFIISALLGSILVTIKITGNVQRKKRLQLEKENRLTEQLLKERERISKELHDNLGASLVTIVAQADNIETQLMNNKTTEALLKTQQLGNQSRETVNILRETIWAVQESEHTLNDFVLRVKNYLQRTLPASNIEWQVTVNGTLDKPLSPVQTLHLFRIIQEATQNIIKHSGATKAGYLFDALNKTLVVTITDNGRGFNSSEQFYTNGLKNMHTRAEEINGRTMVASGPDGTRISVFIET